MRVATVANFGLGIQAWIGETVPDSNKLTKPRSTFGPVPKPRDAFYTSSWDSEKRATPWADYMKVNGSRSGANRSVWLLTPRPEAILFIVNDQDDYELLASQYEKRWDEGTASSAIPPAPDWNRIASNEQENRIDGIHVTQLAVDTSDLLNASWGVESTLWLRWSFLANPKCAATVGERWQLSGQNS